MGARGRTQGRGKQSQISGGLRDEGQQAGGGLQDHHQAAHSQAQERRNKS